MFDRTLTPEGWNVGQIPNAALDILSDQAPQPEATAGQAGATPRASRDTHQHPRLTSSHGDLTLGGDGTLTVTYTRTFDKAPAVVLVPETIAGQGPVVLTYEHIKSGALWTGCKVTGYKAAPVTVGVLGLVVNAFGGSAAGAKFSLVAVASSQP